MRIRTVVMCALIGAVYPSAFLYAAQAADSSTKMHETYTAELQPMNSKLTGLQTTGHAKFQINGDELVITIDVKDAPANTVHWQHFHGLEGTAVATCATPDADKNGDGIVDLIETEPASGTTMVPFDTMPAAMDVAHGEYPKASADGTYAYRSVVSLKDLTAAFTKAFSGQALNLDKRVVLIHGVPADTKLPATVQSLGPIPAHVTVPIACGQIKRSSH